MPAHPAEEDIPPALGTMADHPDHEPLSEHVACLVEGLEEGSTMKNNGIGIEAIHHYHVKARGLDMTVLFNLPISSLIRMKLPIRDKGPVPNAMVEAYKRLCKQMPGTFSSMLKELYRQGGEKSVKLLIKVFEKSASSGRSDYFTTIRNIIREAIVPDPSTQSLDPPLGSANKWSDQGWNHMTFARAIAPIEIVKIFDLEDTKERDDFLARIKNGSARLRASRWGTWVYDEEVYDEDNTDIGLLRGYVAERTSRCLLTGKSTSIWGDVRLGDTDSLAQTLGIKKMDRFIVAFIHTVTQAALMGTEKFNLMISHFSLIQFYNNIIDLMARDPGLEREILDHYDEKIPGLKDVGRVRHGLQAPMSPQPDPVGTALRQRQLRLQAEKEKAATRPEARPQAAARPEARPRPQAAGRPESRSQARAVQPEPHAQAGRTSRPLQPSRSVNAAAEDPPPKATSKRGRADGDEPPANNSSGRRGSSRRRSGSSRRQGSLLEAVQRTQKTVPPKHRQKTLRGQSRAGSPELGEPEPPKKRRKTTHNDDNRPINAGPPEDGDDQDDQDDDIDDGLGHFEKAALAKRQQTGYHRRPSEASRQDSISSIPDSQGDPRERDPYPKTLKAAIAAGEVRRTQTYEETQRDGSFSQSPPKPKPKARSKSKSKSKSSTAKKHQSRKPTPAAPRQSTHAMSRRSDRVIAWDRF